MNSAALAGASISLTGAGGLHGRRWARPGDSRILRPTQPRIRSTPRPVSCDRSDCGYSCCFVRVSDLAVFELAARSEMQPSAVSHALRLLPAHNVVGSRRQGKTIVYSLRSPDVAALLDMFIP